MKRMLLLLRSMLIPAVSFDSTDPRTGSVSRIRMRVDNWSVRRSLKNLQALLQIMPSQ